MLRQRIKTIIKILKTNFIFIFLNNIIQMNIYIINIELIFF